MGDDIVGVIMDVISSAALVFWSMVG
jgi:hypothetical protein